MAVNEVFAGIPVAHLDGNTITFGEGLGEDG